MAVTNPIAPFLWGAGGAALSPEQVAREREIAAALMQGGVDYSPVDHWLQGAARAAQAGVGALKGRWADEAETRGREGFQTQWDSVFGGGPAPAASALAGGGVGAAPSIPAGSESIRAGLIERGLPEHVADAFILNFQDESGLNPGINEAAPTVPGSRGGFGLAQWTGPRRVALEQFAASQGLPVSDPNVQMDFLMSELQGPESRAAQSILGATDTGSAAAAIVNQFLRPAEEHRARREAAYLGGAAPTQQVAQGPDMAALLGLSGNQWASPQQQAVVQALMGQQIQQQDPAYQLGLRKTQAEIDALTAKQAPAGPKYDFVFGPNGELIRTDATSGGFESLGSFAGQPNGDFNTITIDVPGVGPQTFNTSDPDQYQAANALLAQGATEVKTPGVSVTTNVSGGNKFEEAFATQDAAALSALSDAGLAAQRNLGRIDQLENLLTSAPNGFGALMAQKAGEFGVQTEGLDTIQAAQALINSLIPEQRQPGSGPMSDADLELFKQSLPRIINTPQGNKMIVDTMRAVAKYDAEGADIVSRVRLPEGNPQRLTRDQAFLLLQNRSNPLENFRGADIPAQSQANPAVMNQTSSGVTWSIVD